MTRLVTRIVTVLLTVGAMGCRSSLSPSPPPSTVGSFVTAAQAFDGSQGVLHSGAAPSPQFGPSVSPTANASVINGGSKLIRLQGPVPFQVVYLYVNSAAGIPSGYWEIRLFAPTTDVSIIVTFARGLPATNFDCFLAVATPGGLVGSYSGLQNTVVAQANTGEVQVSASWDALSDVDLHVVEPTGAEIYYGNRSSSAGGLLDLDSNPNCQIDRVNNENIRWPTGRAPSGTYTVRLDYYSGCGVSLTKYVVTINNGGTPSIFLGSFTGSGDGGGRGSGRLVTLFSYSASSVAGEGLVFELGNLLVRPGLGALVNKRTK